MRKLDDPKSYQRPAHLGTLLALESRVAPLQKGLDALAVVFGLKGLVRFSPLIFRGRGPSVREPAHEFLVPPVHEWSASRDAMSGGPCGLRDVVVVLDALALPGIGVGTDVKMHQSPPL